MRLKSSRLNCTLMNLLRLLGRNAGGTGIDHGFDASKMIKIHWLAMKLITTTN